MTVQNFFIYCGYQSFLIVMICRYVLQFQGFPFYFLIMSFVKKFFNFDEVQLTFFFRCLCFWCISKVDKTDRWWFKSQQQWFLTAGDSNKQEKEQESLLECWKCCFSLSEWQWSLKYNSMKNLLAVLRLTYIVVFNLHHKIIIIIKWP